MEVIGNQHRPTQKYTTQATQSKKMPKEKKCREVFPKEHL